MAATTTFETYGSPAVVTHSYRSGEAVTPHDTNELTRSSRALYIGSIAGGATMTVVTVDGTTIAFAGLTAATLLPIAVKQVKATGTLASSIVALY